MIEYDGRESESNGTFIIDLYPLPLLIKIVLSGTSLRLGFSIVDMSPEAYTILVKVSTITCSALELFVDL